MPKAIFAIAFALVLIAGLAPAQTNVLEATVPFAFEVNGVLIPGGPISVARLFPAVYMVRNPAGAVSSMFIVQGRRLREPDRNGKGYLSFHRYGDRYFLETITTADGAIVKTPPSRAEQKLLAAAREQCELIVIAAAR